MQPPKDTLNVWSSPNIGQMTEMSQDWYRKIMADSAEQLKIALDNTNFRPLVLDEDFILGKEGSSFGINTKSNDNQLLVHSQPPSLALASTPSQLQTNQFDHQQLFSENDTLFPFNSFPIELNQFISDNVNDDEIDLDLPEIPIFSSPHPDQKLTDCSFLFTPEQSSLTCTRPGSTQYSPNEGKIFFTQELDGDLIPATRGRKYHNSNILAHSCQLVLNGTAHPDFNQIADIVLQLKKNSVNSGIPDKKIRSNVREWFRKRREYMATKIYRSCERLLPKYTTGHGSMNEFLKSIHSNKPLMALIIMESKLPMKSDEEKNQFVKEKITDFYLKYPQRKLRNANTKRW